MSTEAFSKTAMRNSLDPLAQSAERGNTTPIRPPSRQTKIPESPTERLVHVGVAGSHARETGRW